MHAGGDKTSRVELLEIDICDEQSIKKAADKVVKDHGELFGLINNAGGFLSTHRETINLNTYGSIRVSDAFLPLIQSNGVYLSNL